MPSMGYGAGRQRFDERPNLLRVVMGRTDAGGAAGKRDTAIDKKGR